MKIVLALHGIGSSAEIVKDQLVPLTRELSPRYEFVYLDGAVERERGPGEFDDRYVGFYEFSFANTPLGIASYYLGPFYSYTTGYMTAEIREALDNLDQFVREHGPFHGVFSFSQGASMAVSYLLDCQAHESGTKLPFEFAVLFSSVSAFSPSKTCYGSIVEHLLGRDFRAIQAFPEAEFNELTKSEQIFAENLAPMFTGAKKMGSFTESINFFKQRNQEAVPRVLHHSLTQDRITIPTVYVNGKGDPPAMSAQSRLVCGLCDQSLARVHHHSGGHGVPTELFDVKTLIKMIDRASIEGADRHVLHQDPTGIPQR
ncbi:inducible nitrate reductase 2 [Daldinia decipiens]|uniref:inducible nitrate reductase 2 n=1 Tax=Daldinia decipiens TaxID=326647 RepID=UPI0020C40F5E|nr:inducible nitrate reductase 2 [Daldinia decipiens]KAI1656637.1 inducible nitrate reductase 2 [Daldinia decipiens]